MEAESFSTFIFGIVSEIEFSKIKASHSTLETASHANGLISTIHL